MGGVDQIGFVRSWRYDGDANEWILIGSDLVGIAERDRFGISLALSSDGSILAVGSEDTVNSYKGESAAKQDNVAGQSVNLHLFLTTLFYKICLLQNMEQALSGFFCLITSNGML
mgnify:CR=1 FL=1